jgi:C1A family cysteine protease
VVQKKEGEKIMKSTKYFRMKSLITGTIFIFGIFFTISLFSHQGLNDSDDALLSEAPMNPRFIKYLEDEEKGVYRVTQTSDGYPLGVIPNPIDFAYLNTIPTDILSDIDPVALLKNYDLRKKKKLPPVRNQGSCGSCWAFTALAAVESALLPAQKTDLSENNLITKHGFRWGPCKGGNINIATAYFGRWAGPWLESDDPYVKYLSREDDNNVVKHVQNVIFIPARKGPKDNKKIKNAIKKYGAVYTTMFYDQDNQFYHPTHHSYYNPSTEEGSHAVAIVGWIDNYSKNKFMEIPPGNGAFIARNSWGADWGDGGYFYVSYHDAFFARRSVCAAVKKPEAPTNYKELYEYDPSGCTSNLGWPPANVAWFANIFTATSDSNLKAVSFYTSGMNNKYKIYIYTNVDANQPTSGTLARQKSGKIKNPGYYTIKFNNVPVRQGERFSAVVSLETPGYEYPIPIEKPIKKYTKKVNAKNGQSFVSPNGVSWGDLTKYDAYKKTNVCLKVFTK